MVNLRRRINSGYDEHAAFLLRRISRLLRPPAPFKNQPPARAAVGCAADYHSEGKNQMIKKCTIRQVDNGYAMVIESTAFEKFEFVDTSLEGILFILYQVQAEIRKRENQENEKPKKTGRLKK